MDTNRKQKKRTSNSFVADRMYELCLPRLQRYERKETTVGNSHHVAQLMAYYASMSSVSSQQWRIVRLLHEKRSAPIKEIAASLRISPKSVSAQLGNLLKLDLVVRPQTKGGHWSINPFIEPQ